MDGAAPLQLGQLLRASDSVMLILIVPAFLICVGMTVMAYRKWQSSDEDSRP